MTETNNNMFLDWDDAIETDGQEFVLLKDGDYNFTVTDFARGRFPGSAKLPPCNKAEVTLQVNTPEGTATIKTDFILYRTLEWRISAFFRCLGMKKHGERLVMDWNQIVGKKGHAHFKPRPYVDRDGNERKANDVDRFYDYDENYFKGESDYIEIIDDDDDDLPFD